MAAQRWTEYSF